MGSLHPWHLLMATPPFNEVSIKKLPLGHSRADFGCCILAAHPCWRRNRSRAARLRKKRRKRRTRTSPRTMTLPTPMTCVMRTTTRLWTGEECLEAGGQPWLNGGQRGPTVPQLWSTGPNGSQRWPTGPNHGHQGPMVAKSGQPCHKCGQRGPTVPQQWPTGPNGGQERPTVPQPWSTGPSGGQGHPMVANHLNRLAHPVSLFSPSDSELQRRQSQPKSRKKPVKEEQSPSEPSLIDSSPAEERGGRVR